MSQKVRDQIGRDRPAKGSCITIEPLRTLAEVQRVKAAISCPRDLALFTLGVNTNLRASDLLELKPSDIDWLSSQLIIRESKTGKKREIPLSPQLVEMLIPYAGQEYLFASVKTGKPLTISAWNNLIKRYTFRAGIRGNYGARSIRKTWARLQYEVFKTPIVLISQELNHSSLRETYRYIGILPTEVQDVYRNFI